MSVKAGWLVHVCRFTCTFF